MPPVCPVLSGSCPVLGCPFPFCGVFVFFHNVRQIFFRQPRCQVTNVWILSQPFGREGQDGLRLLARLQRCHYDIFVVAQLF